MIRPVAPAGGGAFTPHPREAGRVKNIILLITDTFRYDNLFARAERPVRTPELNGFAQEMATAVEHFYTGSFPTIPHRTDVATGVLGWPHYPWQPLDVSGPNHAAQILKAAGYATQLICDCPHLFNARFQHGFDAAFQTRGQEGDRALLHLNDPVREVVPLAKTRQQNFWRGHPVVDFHRWHNREYQYEAETFVARTAGLVVRWLEENSRGGPFFLWADFFDPHEPWDPPEYLVRHYDPDYAGTPMLHPNYGPDSDYTAAELHNLWAHYAAEAELVDRMLGRVLQKVDDLQLWDDSLVVVTSDHGFSIGEHGRAGKSNIHPTHADRWPLYPEVAHVPFLVAGGGVPQGQSRQLFAQPVDILPTLCELAGAKATPPQPFQGRSFAPALLGQAPDAHREFAVSGSFIAPRNPTVPAKAVTPAVYTAEWCYVPVGRAGEVELYDRRADPFAKTNVAADQPDVVQAMHERLFAHLREHNASEATLKLWAR